MPERRWPVEWFAAVGTALARRSLRLVLTGTGNEAALTAAVAKALETPALDLAGRTDLGCLAALLSRTRLLVCNDTGVSHLADALSVPSIVLSTGDNAARWGAADRRLHRVYSDAECVRSSDVAPQAEAACGMNL